MAEQHTWQKEFDKWVVATDGTTILLERAAEKLIRSESDSLAASDMHYGEYLGICYSLAVLSGVPYKTVCSAVARMVGGDGDAQAS